ncbi:unnamed protein product, partial [marine sediment metagenome]
SQYYDKANVNNSPGSGTGSGWISRVNLVSGLSVQEGIFPALSANSGLRTMTGINNSVIGQDHKLGMDAVH